VLHTGVLGLALAGFRVWPGAGTLLPALADSPQQREAVCRLYRGIRIFLLLPRRYDTAFDDGDSGGGGGSGGGEGGGGGGGPCPPSAPTLVAFWVHLMSLLVPLAVAYVIELRAKGAFLRARGLQPNIAAGSVAVCMGAGLVYVTHLVWLAIPHFAC
jgi:hypothetical protein